MVFRQSKTYCPQMIIVNSRTAFTPKGSLMLSIHQCSVVLYWPQSKYSDRECSKVALFIYFIHNHHKLFFALHFRRQCQVSSPNPSRRLVDALKSGWMYIGHSYIMSNNIVLWFVFRKQSVQILFSMKRYSVPTLCVRPSHDDLDPQFPAPGGDDEQGSHAHDILPVPV